MGDRFLYVHHTLTLIVSLFRDRPKHSFSGIYLDKYIPFRVYYSHENTLDRSDGAKPLPYCRAAARWPSDRGRNHPAARITATAGVEAPQGAERGCHCGGSAAGQPENLSVEARAVPGVGDLAPLVSSPLGRTLRSSGRLSPGNAGQRATQKLPK